MPKDVIAGLVVAVMLVGSLGCARKVKPIDLHDETIPLEARRLVADAEDSIAIARARLDEAERELQKTLAWKENLFSRDWPSGAESALPKLRKLAASRVALSELQVERAEENIDLARAKYKLITAKTAIRQDLAVYELDPLRETVKKEGDEVDELDDKIASRRQKIAQVANAWWDSYAKFVKGGGNSRALFVGAAPPKPAANKPSKSDK